jgi:hypothetical protein
MAVWCQGFFLEEATSLRAAVSRIARYTYTHPASRALSCGGAEAPLFRERWQGFHWFHIPSGAVA